jgi:hypothetical protein
MSGGNWRALRNLDECHCEDHKSHRKLHPQPKLRFCDENPVSHCLIYGIASRKQLLEYIINIMVINSENKLLYDPYTCSICMQGSKWPSVTLLGVQPFNYDSSLQVIIPAFYLAEQLQVVHWWNLRHKLPPFRTWCLEFSTQDSKRFLLHFNNRFIINTRLCWTVS